MTAAERQNLLIEEYGLIHDPRERFQVIVETAAAVAPPFPEAERREENLVPGCVTKVWLWVGRDESGGLEVRIDSESPTLRAIGALFYRVYAGASPGEFAATAPAFVEGLGLDRHLTPTRLRGVRRLYEMLVERAANLANSVER